MSVSGQTTRKIDWMKASFHRIFFFPYFYLCHLHQLYESPLFVVEAQWAKNKVQSNFGPGSVEVQSRFGRSLVEVRSQFGCSSVTVRSKFGQSSVKVRSKFGRSSVEVRSKFGRSSVEVRSKFGRNSWYGISHFALLF